MNSVGNPTNGDGIMLLACASNIKQKRRIYVALPSLTGKSWTVKNVKYVYGRKLVDEEEITLKSVKDKKKNLRRRYICFPSGCGKTWAVHNVIQVMGRVLVDQDEYISMTVGWPTGRWWDDPEKARLQRNAMKTEIIRWLNSPGNEVMLGSEAEFMLGPSFNIPTEKHDELIRKRDEMLDQPTVAKPFTESWVSQVKDVVSGIEDAIKSELFTDEMMERKKNCILSWLTMCGDDIMLGSIPCLNYTYNIDPERHYHIRCIKQRDCRLDKPPAINQFVGVLTMPTIVGAVLHAIDNQLREERNYVISLYEVEVAKMCYGRSNLQVGMPIGQVIPLKQPEWNVKFESNSNSKIESDITNVDVKD